MVVSQPIRIENRYTLHFCTTNVHLSHFVVFLLEYIGVYCVNRLGSGICILTASGAFTIQVGSVCESCCYRMCGLTQVAKGTQYFAETCPCFISPWAMSCDVPVHFFVGAVCTGYSCNKTDQLSFRNQRMLLSFNTFTRLRDDTTFTLIKTTRFPFNSVQCDE